MRFECVDGYELVGLANITCLPSGNWSGDQPECQSKYILSSSFIIIYWRALVIHCPHLVPPERGSKSSNETKFGTTVSFSCIEGYEIDGNSRLTCLSTRNWTSSEPNCSRKHVLIEYY